VRCGAACARVDRRSDGALADAPHVDLTVDPSSVGAASRREEWREKTVRRGRGVNPLLHDVDRLSLTMRHPGERGPPCARTATFFPVPLSQRG